MKGTPREEPLIGGNVGRDIIRVADTVRRRRQPWLPSVDALLANLEAVGVDGAPRAQGYDERSRKVLPYVARDVEQFA